MSIFPYKAIVITRYKSPPGTPPVLLLQDDHVTIQSGDEDWLTGINAEGKEIVIPASLVEKIDGSNLSEVETGELEGTGIEEVGENVAEKKQSIKEVIAPSEVESSTSSTDIGSAILPAIVIPTERDIPTPPSASSSPSASLYTEKSTITTTPLSPISTTPTLTSSLSPVSASSSSELSSIKGVAPDAPAKPMSLRDRINALNASPSSAPLLPPVPRPKPTFTRKAFVAPASSISTESTTSSTTTPTIPNQSTSPPSISSNLPSTASNSSSIKSAMSAEDAKISIGASGGSLKDRIAALQGLKLDSAVAQVPNAPGRAPKVWKRKEAEVVPEAVVESETETRSEVQVEKDESVKEEIDKSEAVEEVKEKAEEEDLDRTTSSIEENEKADTESILSPVEPEPTSITEPTLTEEEEEATKKAALVQRMASLGGQRVGMAMPALPKRAGPPRRKAAAATVAVAAVAAAIAAPEIIGKEEEKVEESDQVGDVKSEADTPTSTEKIDVGEVKEKDGEDLSEVKSNVNIIPSSAALEDDQVTIPILPLHHEQVHSEEELREVEALPFPSRTSLSVNTEFSSSITVEPLTPLSLAIQQVLEPPSTESIHTIVEAAPGGEPEEVEKETEEKELEVTKEDESLSLEVSEIEPVEEEQDESPIEEDKLPSVETQQEEVSVAGEEEREEVEEEEEGEKEEEKALISASIPTVPSLPSPINTRPPIPSGRPVIPASFSPPPPAQIEREIITTPRLPPLPPPPTRPIVSIPVAQRYDQESVDTRSSISDRREMLEKEVELKSPVSFTAIDDDGEESKTEESPAALEVANDAQVKQDEEEEEDKEEEEDPEVVRRAALAKRMAALGGMNMRMGPMFPPVGGLRKAKSTSSNSETTETLQSEESTSPISTRSGGIPSRGVLMPGMMPRLDSTSENAVPLAVEQEDDLEETEIEEEESSSPPLPIGRPPVPSPSKSLPPPPPTRDIPSSPGSIDSTSPPPLPSGRPILPPLRQFVEEPDSFNAEEIMNSTNEEPEEEGYDLPRKASVSSFQSLPNSSIRSLSPSLPPPSRQLPQPAISNVEASSPIASSRHVRNNSVAQSERSLAYSEKSSGGQKAKDLDLGSSNFWLQVPFGPPEFLKAADDLSVSITESGLNHGLHNNQIKVIYDDLSSTIISISFDDKDITHAEIQQAHFPQPSVSLAQLVTFSSKLGSQFFAAAYSLKSSKHASASSFTDACYSRATEILNPIGCCYGFTIYSVHVASSSDKKLVQPIIEEIDTPRVGDIVVINSAKFKHNLTTVKVGTDKPEVAVLESYDSKKRKIKVLEVGKDGSVVEGGYRLEDLKSGEVKIFRAIPRSLLD